MEGYQKDHIVKNLPTLIGLTSCTPIFLTTLQSAGILSGEEISTLSTIGSTVGQHQQSHKFYDIIKTKRDSYNLLKQALEATSQTGALAILDQVNEHNYTTPFRNHGSITYNKKVIIGRGSYQSKVYKGKFQNRDVAVKKVHNEYVDKERVIHEINLLIRLDSHPNVMRYFTAEITQHFTLIALELCAMDLHVWVTTSNSGLEISGLDIIKQATKGIRHLHSNQVIHRDLKPENILLTCPGAGNDVLVKIADFGTSKFMKDGFAKMFRHTSGVGTEGWKAPELADQVLLQNGQHSENMGFASDIFSLGCIYYFVITGGEHPFGENKYIHQVNILLASPKLNEDKIITMKHGKAGLIILIRRMIAYEFSERPSLAEINKSLADLEMGENVGAGIHPLSPTRKKATYVSYMYRRMEEAIDAKDEVQTRALLARGELNVNETNYMSETLLHRAAASDDKGFAIKIIMLLIEKNANASAKDKEGYTFLHRLVDDGTTLTPDQLQEISTFLISKDLAHLFNIPEAADQQFRFERFFEIYNSSTPFHMAVKNIEIDMSTLKQLQANKVDLSAVNSRGNTPLFYALMGRRTIQFLRDMIELKADVKHLNKFNDSLLHYAALYGEVEHMRFFLERGHDVNAQSKAGYTPLSLITGFRSGYLMDKCSFLIDNGACVNSKNTIGMSPMDFVTSASESDVLDKEVLTGLLSARE